MSTHDPTAPPPPPSRAVVLHAAETLLHAGYTIEGLAVLQSLLPAAKWQRVLERVKALPIVRRSDV